MLKNTSDSTKDKIDVESLIGDFRVSNVQSFASYLKEIWRDLASRSDDKTKGINKITFAKYYELPGIISDRLFAVLDSDKNGYLDLVEFIEGMTTLFSEGYDRLAPFVFNFYDFDKDHYISKEDIRTVLSYVPLNTKSKITNMKLTFEKETYKDRVESQEELHFLLEAAFKDKEAVNLKQFMNIIENTNSDIFLFILIFIYENRPFNKQTLENYENAKANNNLKISKSPQINPNKLIASPNLNSKFSPVVTISKSPTMTKKTPFMEQQKKNSLDILNKFSGKDQPADSRNVLLKYAQGGIPNSKPTVITTSAPKEDTDENVAIKNIPVNRKNRNFLKNIENLETSTKQNQKTQYADLPIEPAVSKFKNPEESKEKITNGMAGLAINEQDDSDDDDLKSRDLKHDGYLFKITQSKKLKKLFFKLIHRDLYYYKSNEEKQHKGMHHLSGVFIQEEKPITYEGTNLFCFSVIYPKKSRFYYVDNEEEFRTWLKLIRRATGYQSLTDIYDVKEKLGNGKFGLVRLGIHKENYRRVAVKIMSKKDMSTQDQELVKTEIDILKIGQHPNIIRLYDIFENNDYIYIIMEYCSGGDLFSYIEKRGFRLAESRAAQIVHKLATAVFYLHSYGIAHRDLKPENILMTDNTDEADIRLLDFGLSKIIGPNETCMEPYGTLSYVAPEVLLEKPYTKAVDLWSIGVITYLLLCGCLPFDHETSEREIARQTIHEVTPFPTSIWKKLSLEARNFVDALLQKEPSKRITIKEALEHPWIQKFNKTKLPEMRRKSKEFNASTFKIYSTTEEGGEKA